jgi:hypothetical protein
MAKHINKQNVNVTKRIQHLELTQFIATPYKHQNRQQYETLLI